MRSRLAVAVAALGAAFGYPAPPQTTATAWLDATASSRIAVEVDAAGVARSGAIAEIELRRPPSRVVEVETDDRVKDASVPFQFDNQRLLFLLTGETRAEQVRRFHLYFGGAAASQPKPQVTVTDGVECAEQTSVRVRTPSAVYCYHKEGAGFASILDSSGNEWIGYKPGGRSAGEFRGIPNLGNFAHPGYSGEKGAVTRIAASGPLCVTLVSEGRDARWALRWDIFPGHARMTLLRHAEPYWFLYEGTPGGRLDLENGFQVTSSGLRRSLAEAWSGDLPAPEWIYFANADSGQVLFLAKHEDNDASDQYWPMEGNMTVFGFGRQYRCCGKYLDTSPARFTIGLAPAGPFAGVRRSIESAYRELRVSFGSEQMRPR